MQVVRQGVSNEPLELRLFAEAGQGLGGPRKQAWAASLALHVGILALLMTVSPARTTILRAPAILLERATPLVAPPPETAPLTQRAPNVGKVGREFDLESLLPAAAAANASGRLPVASRPRGTGGRFCCPA
jgi:hypothetical protein